ncbi:hypothetical protein JHK85_020812 [Glycine max]|nr:hypothetical protein JHK85_020812 [Glycine max]
MNYKSDVVFHSILVPYGNGDGNAPWSSVPQKDDNVRFPSLHSTPKYFTVWNPPTGNVSDNSTAVSIPRRKMRCMMPPKSRTLFQEMNRILVRKRASARAMRPRLSSKLDLEILAARSEIEHAPIVTHDKELYAPLFRKVSMFKRYA